MGMARAKGLRADEMPISSHQLRELVDMVESKTLTGGAAKSVLLGLEEGEMPSAAAERLNVLAMDDDGAVKDAARAAIAANTAAVDDFRGGKQAAIGRLIGDVMKRTGGRAKPDDVRAALLEILNGN